MRVVSKACGSQANFVVMGSKAGDAFESNAKVIDAYSHFWLQPGILDPQLETFGVFKLTVWRGMPIYVCEEVFEDDDGTVKP
jgi:hypothetical protein